MELDTIPQPALEQIERLQGIDLVVGVLGSTTNGHSATTIAMVREALGTLTNAPRAVLVLNDGQHAPGVEEQQSLPVLFWRLSGANAPESAPQSVFDAYHTIFGVSGKLGARACGVIASELRTVTPRWIDRLVRPALEMDFDLITPRYARHKWEGLLNRSIIAPFSRALYGRRIQNPMGPDFGISGKLLKWILSENAGPRRGNPFHPVASIASAATCGGFQICEADVGVRLPPPTDWMNLSSLIAEILGPLFVDMERNAAAWQRVRGSQPIPEFGDREPAPDEGGAVDVQRLIDSFQLGAQNLQDIWSLVLPPATLFEIRKLSRLAAGQFRIPDDLWVWIVYDFALGHHGRAINRDHLLRAFTPLYLGWIASYAIEMETADAMAVEARLERLAAAFEAGKPYLVSRWRWPDRFNP